MPAGAGRRGSYARLSAELELQEELAREYVRKNGWKVLGRVGAKNVSPYRCAKSWRELGKLVPHIAAGRGQKEARLAAIAELRAFRAAHREAKRRWVRSATPLRVLHGARGWTPREVALSSYFEQPPRGVRRYPVVERAPPAEFADEVAALRERASAP